MSGLASQLIRHREPDPRALSSSGEGVAIQRMKGAEL